MLVLWARTLCLWAKTPVRTGVVLSMSTLSMKGIELMDWPAPSPDVNPIEHVWNSLTTDLGGPRSAIRKLIRSFNFMCRVVIDARGGLARYLLTLVRDFRHVTLLYAKFHAQPTDMQTFKFR